MKKLKKRRVVISIAGLIIVAILLIFYLGVSIKTIGNNKIEINIYDKYFETGYRATFFNKSIDQYVTVKNNIDVNTIGNYEVEYTYKWFIFKKTAKRQVIVKDLEKPKIELLGEKSVPVEINTEYEELGYNAVDNYDGIITDSVKVVSNLDSSKLGDYEIKYIVTDTGGNETIEIRNVKVTLPSPLSMSLTDFNMDGWYTDTILPKSKPIDEEQFKKIVFIGDSINQDMYYQGILPESQVWSRPCLTPSTMFSWEIDIWNVGTKEKLLDAIDSYKPEYIVLSPGIFSTIWISEQVFFDNLEKILLEIKTISPNTKIMVQSILPVAVDNGRFSNDTINKYNFKIVELCNKLKVKFLNIGEAMKDETGNGVREYYVYTDSWENKGFHLNGLGYKVMMEYVKTHAYVE